MIGRCEIAALGKVFRTYYVNKVTFLKGNFLGAQYFDAHGIRRATSSASGLQ